MAIYHSSNSLQLKAETHHWGCRVSAFGTRAELISSGLAANYMFDQLAGQNTRSGSTEYGDKFTLKRLKKERYEISLRTLCEAEIPFDMRGKNPYQTDISDILERISGGAS